MDTEKYVRLVQAHRSEILAAEQYIWAHPETGYREWNTSAYLEQIFANAGYTLTKAGNIPGFYTDIDTGRPGPKLLILCELDALYVPNHFAAVDGCAHACGHHAQCAAMVGLALALKASSALDGLSGSIRLMAVPAEECIQTEFRAGLRQQGVIRYLGGKDEFMYRGYFDGVNLAFMFHTGGSGKSLFDVHAGCNGSIIKQARYEGVATHAASTPELGVNALYAASLGLQAINSLRETFRDQDHARVHPIMTDGGDSVSVIPSSSALAMMVRGGSLSSIRQTSLKVDRALAAGALALGARLHVTDYPGYAPLHNAPMMVDFAVEVMSQLVGSDRTLRTNNWGSGSTDMGNVSCVMPVLHPYIGGAAGKSHGDDYRIVNPENACIVSAEGQLALAARLLENDAAAAEAVIASYHAPYASIRDYLADWDRFGKSEGLISYGDGQATVRFGSNGARCAQSNDLR